MRYLTIALLSLASLFATPALAQPNVCHSPEAIFALAKANGFAVNEVQFYKGGEMERVYKAVTKHLGDEAEDVPEDVDVIVVANVITPAGEHQVAILFFDNGCYQGAHMEPESRWQAIEKDANGSPAA